LVSQILLDGKGGSYTSTLEAYRVKAEFFLCGALQKNSGGNILKSPGGMFWIQSWNNMQYVTTAAFLLTVASDYYEAAHQTLQQCTSSVANADMLAAGKEQVKQIPIKLTSLSLPIMRPTGVFSLTTWTMLIFVTMTSFGIRVHSGISVGRLEIEVPIP